MDELLVERVLRAAELVPSGRVASYGDLAAIVGIGPRHVGAVLSRWGSSVPWWRITNSYGDPPAPLRAEAFEHWAAEGIAVKPNGLGCRIADFRADLGELAQTWRRAVTELESLPADAQKARPGDRTRERDRAGDGAPGADTRR